MDPNHLSKTRRIATLRRGLCQLPTLPAEESDRGKVIHAKVREYLAMWSKSKQAPQDVTIGLISTFFADNLNVIDCRGTLAKYSRSTQSVGPKPLVRVWYGDSEATLGRCWDRSQIYNVVHIVLREDGKIDEGLVDVEAPFTLNIVIARADEDKGKTPKTSITEEHWFTSAIAGHGTMRAPMYDTCTLEHKLQGIAVSVEAWIIAGLTRGPKQAQVDYVKSVLLRQGPSIVVSTLYERGFDVTSNVDKESVVRETLITHFSIPQRLITYVLPRILCSEIYSRALRLSEVANRTETTLSSTNNGVHYKGNRKHQIAAWLYITLAAIVSLAVGITNAGGRSGVYERVMDVFATASFLLVSVFGLLKLRSEDQGVLHNTLRGYELITSFKRVAEVTSGGDKELLRKCANLGLGNFSWLNSAGSCYATVDTTGVVLYSDGISNATLADNCWYYEGKTASNMITGRTASVSRWGNKYHFQYDAGTEQVYGYWFEPNGRTANRNVTGPMSADVIKTFNYKV